jgi:uncharacterized protein YkwD
MRIKAKKLTGNRECRSSRRRQSAWAVGHVETLEHRLAFSVAMTASETMLLHLVNQTRTTPQEWGQRLNISLSSNQQGPFAPVVANQFLLAAARLHSQDMLTNNYFSHTGRDGTDPWDRAKTAGYPSMNVGENIYMDYGYGSYEAEAIARRMNDGWFTSSGHRANMLTADWTEFGGGIDVRQPPNGKVYATELFGKHAVGPYVTGVVFNDLNANGSYNVGEGLSNVVVQVGGQQAVTNEFGNYEMKVTAGNLSISAMGGGFSGTSTVVTPVANKNVKVDFRSGVAGAIVNFTPVDGTSGPSLPGISVADVVITEGNSGEATAEMTVTLSKAAATAVTVAYRTQDVTATVADADYVAVAAGTPLVIAAGQTTGKIVVKVKGDTKLESDETFKVVLSGPQNATIDDGEGVCTITNDDSASPSVPSLSIGGVTITEGNGGTKVARFEVSLSSAASAAVTVGVSTEDGTATAADADFVPLSSGSQITFAPGQTTKTIDVQVSGDTKFEQDETFTVVLSAPVNATIGQAIGVGLIVNDDKDPYALPVVNLLPAIVVEPTRGRRFAEFKMDITGEFTSPFWLSYETRDGTAKSRSDYTRTTGMLKVLPGHSGARVLVGIVGDKRLEVDEAFSLVVRAIGNDDVTVAGPFSDGLGQAAGEVQALILDDDSRVLTVHAAEPTVAAGGTAEYTVALNRLPGYGDVLPSADSFADWSPEAMAGLARNVRFGTSFKVGNASGFGISKGPAPGRNLEFAGGKLEFGFFADQAGEVMPKTTEIVEVQTSAVPRSRTLVFQLYGAIDSRIAIGNSRFAVIPAGGVARSRPG